MGKQPKDSDNPGLSVIDQRRLPPGEDRPLSPLPLEDFYLVPDEPGSRRKEVSNLVLLSRRDLDPPRGQVFAVPQQKLLDLAIYILNELDPVTNEQLLARIRKLMEDQKRS